MIPIRDNIPSRTTPYVNYALIALNVLTFLYEVSLGPQLESLVRVYGLIPARLDAQVVILGAPPAAITLASSLFLHGGWLHLGGNMLYLWIFGDNVEDRLGHARYVLFYFLCGILSGLTHVFFFPDSTVPTVGASGAIAGVLGAYFILYPWARVRTLIPIVIIPWFVDIPALVYLGIWFVMQLLSGSAEVPHQRSGEGSGVAFMAHVGGFVAGVILCLLLRRHEQRPFWQAPHEWD